MNNRHIREYKDHITSYFGNHVLPSFSATGDTIFVTAEVEHRNSQTSSSKSSKRVMHHQPSFVETPREIPYNDWYRAENAGKFPKISHTQKQVGGSYYVIREIVLELEYESKMNSSNSVDKFFVGKKFDESKLLTTESVNVPSGNIEIEKESPVKDDSQSVVLDDNESVNTGYEHLEENRQQQTSYLERRLSDKLEIMSTPVIIALASLLVMNIVNIVVTDKQ
ncbi:uncharacterized protein LOC114378922 [Glycine soja]|uniref:uncharacterized protein LOC114378922 n=1 Tax=Glycine soja TaxID=3848 RepID=UPI00103ECBD1|nr:uncharacterized protein LOC114378922 [Glycine soja]